MQVFTLSTSVTEIQPDWVGNCQRMIKLRGLADDYITRSLWETDGDGHHRHMKGYR